MKLRTFALVLALTAPAIPAWAFPPIPSKAKEDPRETVEGTIAEMIRLVEAKEPRKFLEEFVPPEMLAELKKQNKLDELVENMQPGKIGIVKLTEMLAEAKKTKPEMSADGKTATFKLSDGVPWKLGKIEKKWYPLDQ